MSIIRFVRSYAVALQTPGTHVVIGTAVPGIGKSDVAQQVSRSMGIKDQNHLELFPAQCGPETFYGWQVPRADGLHNEAEYQIRRLAEIDEPAHIVLDEISNTPRATQAGMLSFMRRRRAGETYLDPARVKMSAFMNPPDSAADAQDISFPMANRSIWLPVDPPSREEHIAYLATRGKGVKFDIPVWNEDKFWTCYDEAVAFYKTFMELDVHAVLLEDINDEEVQSRFPLAYATHRSWETAVRVAAACKAMGAEDVMIDLLEGTIGKQQGGQFAAAIENLDLIPFDKLRKNHKLWVFDPKRTDKTFAQLHHVAIAATSDRFTKPEQNERFNDGFSFLAYAFTHGAPEDTCIVAAQHMGTHRPSGASLKPHIDVIESLAPLVKAAGYTIGGK